MLERHSKWRIDPVSEKEFFVTRRQIQSNKLNSLMLWTSTLFVCPCLCMSPYNAFSSGSLNILLTALATLAIITFGITLGRSIQFGNAKHDALAALRKEFSGAEGWFVEITVRQGEAISGIDCGFAWFEDDFFRFSGVRMSFSLGVGDISTTSGKSTASLDLVSGPVLPLIDTSTVGQASIGVKVIGLHDKAFDESYRFHYQLNTWLHSAPQIKGQLPPMSPGPELPSIADLQLEIIASYASWASLAAFLFLMTNDFSAWSIILFVALGALIARSPALQSPRRATRAVEDRKRIEAYNKEQ